MDCARIVRADQAASGYTPFEVLRDSRTALLTTFRRNGQTVATIVEIRVAGGKAYLHTWSTTGKVKRLAHNPRVMLATCTLRGDVIGPTVEGIAQRLKGRDAERAAAARDRRLVVADLATSRRRECNPR